MQSVTNQPTQPVQPEQISKPVLEIGSAALPGESSKAFHKRCKEAAREIKRFIRENRSMQLVLEGKKYPRAEVWQFGAACLGITAMVTKTEEVISDQGEELGFVSIAHALNARGRVISGAEAACMHSEQDWQGKPSFQLRAMAETRSCSRVLRHVLAYVMVMAGLCPTPAEEMGPGESRQREITTPCDVCGAKVSAKRRLQQRKKHGRSLCLTCEKVHIDNKGREITAPLNDPKKVGEFIADAKAKKANAAQPIVKALDHQDPSEVVA